MNEDGQRPAPQPLDLLIEEILRWNSQMNLVTRVDTADRLQNQIESCVRGWRLVVDALAGASGFRSSAYVDLGSGSGLPGLVWTLARRAAGHDGPVYLVEPRAKRAWFLRRASRLLGLAGVTVIEERWGDGGRCVIGAPSRDALISMKALKLNDHEVLTGLEASFGPGRRPERVWIARFLPVDPGRAEVASGGGAATDTGAFALSSRAILGESAPRLELVTYSFRVDR